MKFRRIRAKLWHLRMSMVAFKHRLKSVFPAMEDPVEESSISDNGQYPQFCRRVLQSESEFATFRRAPEYTQILEHVPAALGLQYLHAIKRHPFVWVRAPFICNTDVIGGPNLRSFPEIGLTSATTLRYLKVYADLITYFGPLSGLAVGEIGVGYGGQCRVINLLDTPKRYSLIDLPDVLRLTERYLIQSGITGNIEAHSSKDDSEVDVELLLSNYAFSELKRPVQDAYFERVICRSKWGYFTFNSISPKKFNCMSAEEFAERIGGLVVKETPLSYPGNKIVVWAKVK